jgi:tetratricopeptide (TPR) repeat protein
MGLRDGFQFGEKKVAPDRDGRTVPATEYARVDDSLRALWLGFPEHPGLIEALHASEAQLVLRYAALTGKYWFVSEVTSELASFAAQLADIYRSICPVVDEAELGRLLAPQARIDVLKQLRVGFEHIDRWSAKMAPEVEKTWPRCDQRAVVYMIGELVSDYIFQCRDRALLTVIDRCRERKPNKRYQTVEEVYQAFAKLAVHYQRMPAADFAVWKQIEEGMGWMEYGYPKRALESVEPFREHETFGKLARTCHRLSQDALSRELAKPTIAWPAAEPDILRLEANGKLSAALDLFDTVTADPAHQIEIEATRARIHFGLGQTAQAIKYARQVLAADPSRTELRNILVKALLVAGKHQEALVEIDAPRDAAQHYLRGKVLLALSRLEEARDAFEHACLLQPMMLEAMLLRREVDRCMANGRRAVGAQGPITFDIPASLAELRDVLISGRTADAIDALSQPRFADDPDAQLVLARMLVFDRQLERAVQIYDRIAQLADPHRHTALVGKASVLLDLGKLESALALFDLLCSEKPNDSDASEGRARALEKAGRVGEAAAEYRRFVALATSRSDARVRAAQRWLESNG